MRRMLISRPPVRRYGRVPAVEFNGGRRLPLDVMSDEAGYTVLADVPGLQADDIRIELEDDVLTLKAEQPQIEADDRESVWQERRRGTSVRKLRLPEPIDRDGIEAWVENGVLTVVLPKAEEARPRKIEVAAR
jgi:HSP20 family protein